MTASDEAMALSSHKGTASGIRVLHAWVGGLLLILVLSPACAKKTSPPSHAGPAPAKVEKLPLETEISRITLAPEAEQRLGIALAQVTRRRLQRRRTFGGDVVVPGGKAIIVSAPLAGTIAPPAQRQIPLPGQLVDAGEPVISLIPLLTPERYVPTPAERAQMANAKATMLAALTVAKGDVQRGQAEVDGARIAFARAEQLLADRVGSARAMDDAKALLNIAESTLQAAKDREQQFEKLLVELESFEEGGNASPLSLVSPQTGVIRSLSVSRGQTVAPGAALFEVVDTSTMWIRLPLYVDLIPMIDTQADANLVALGRRAARRAADEPHSLDNSSEDVVARPVTAPPTADALNTTADLYYEVDNADNTFRPGQRVGLSLKLRGEEESLVVPSNAILYDIFGGTWVYVKSGDHAFERHRVLIRYTANDQAVLDRGPAEGTQVVTDGAAELYGTEFGAGK